MLKDRIIDSIIFRFNNPKEIAIYFFDQKELKIVENLSFIKNIIILFDNFKLIKSENIILPGEKNRFCLEAIYAAILANKSFTNLNFNQPKERIIDALNQFSDFKIFSCNELKTYIKKENKNYKFEKIQEKIYSFKSFKNDLFENKTAYYMFTSGSTGIPKGVSINPISLNRFMDFINEKFIKDQNNFFKNQLSLSPLYFDNFIFDLCYFNESKSCMFLIDIKAINQTNFKSLSVLKKINFVYGAPSIIKILILNHFFSYISKGNSKDIFVGFGGEPFSWNSAMELLKQLTLGSTIVNFYGPTECTCMCSSYSLEPKKFFSERIIHEKYSSLLPIGNIFPYFSYLIKNKVEVRKNLNNGELLLGGIGLMNGYLDKKINNFEKINNENFYNTGDLVSTNDGEIFYIHGRKDNQIKIKGNRIEIEEVENRIRTILNILNLIIIDVQDRGIIRLVLVIATQKDNLHFEKSIFRIENEREMITRLRKKLPSVMSISDIFTSSSFPLTANGKIDRKNIRKLVYKIFDN